MALPILAPPKPPKLPNPESTTQPSFASPNIQTAPDVKQSQAVAGNAPVPTVAPQGPENVPATPKPAAKAPAPGPTVTSATPRAAATPAATVPTSTGAPPGVPATTPAVPVGLPPTPKSLENKTASQQELTAAENKHENELFDAALAYNGGPTSALTLDQLNAQKSLDLATANRGAAGTIESSLFGGDKGRISTAKATADLKAYNTYQESVRNANSALEQARAAYERASQQEKREIEEAAQHAQPTEGTVPRASIPANPGGERTVMGPAGPGGVVPYEETVKPGEGVRVGLPPRPRPKR